MKKHILFVDDDNNVLEGLRRTFRTQRKEWDIQYVISGAEALEVMDSTPIDLIVTDMRMPEMDGAELLRMAMKRHPDAIRMVFSGQADSDLTMKAVGVAHQFISKPCEPEILKSIISRAINLRSLLKDSKLGKELLDIDTLPSVPSLYLELSNELQASEPSIHKVGQIIARDPGMTAKILQLTNSAFFGLRRRISNTGDAAAYLGLDRIQQLFLAIYAFAQFTPPSTSAFSLNLLWEHSISTASLAKEIVLQEEASRSVAEDAFTAGLLHDIGKLVLACKLSDRHEEAVKLARTDAIPLWRAEDQIFALTHAEVGAYLMGLWGLPDAVVDAIAYHHRPMDAAKSEFCALTALHAADCQINNNSYAGISPPQHDSEYLAQFLHKTVIRIGVGPE